MILTSALACAAGLAVFAAVAASAEAHQGRAYSDGVTITAYSRHGNGSISGPVRRGHNSWEDRAWEGQSPHGS